MWTKCKPDKRYGQKFFTLNDPSSQFIRLQCGATGDGLVNLQSIVDTFAGLDEAISDVGSTSETEVNGGNNGDNNSDNDDDNNEVKNTSKQCDKRLLKKVESDSKRKSSEAGCSEQNKTLPGKPENTKRMKMNTSSTVEIFENSLSTDNISMSSIMFSDSSSSDDDDSESWVSTDDDNDDSPIPNGNFGRVYNSLFHGDSSHDSSDDSDCEAARDSELYCFLNERKDNQLSQLLKIHIDKLPIPVLLKRFLNYKK